MSVYIFASILSILFAYLSQHLRRKNGSLTAAGRAADNTRRFARANPRGCIRLNKNRMIEQFFLFLSFLPLFIVSAVRYLVGTDYATTYRQVYQSVCSLGYRLQISGENLYKLLNRIAMIYSGSDYVGVFALSSLLICGFIFAAVKRQSADKCYSILLFIVSGFYFWSFNAVRQMIAMAVFLYALQYVWKGKPWKYAACILLAAGFHTSALIYLPVYFIKKIKLSPKMIVILSAVAVSSVTVLRNLAYAVTSKIEIFNIYATRYLNRSGSTSAAESSSVHTLINLVFLVLYVLIAKVYDKKGEKSNIWVAFQFLAFVFASLSGVLPVASRISRLFAITQIISIPFMTGLITNKKMKIILNMSIIACYTAYCAVTFFILGYHDILPYRTIFSR